VGGASVGVIHRWLVCCFVGGGVGLGFVVARVSGWRGWVVFEGLRVDSCGVGVVCGVLLGSARVAGGVVDSVFEVSGSVRVGVGVAVGEISGFLVVRQWVLAGVLEALAWEAYQSVAGLVRADQQLAVMGR